MDALTTNPRYKLLNEQIFAARGEDITLDIAGDERLRTTADSIAPEAACTSVQCHLQVARMRSGLLERRAVDRRRAARARRELAVPVRAPTVAGDPHRPVPAGHRYAGRS